MKHCPCDQQLVAIHSLLHQDFIKVNFDQLEFQLLILVEELLKSQDQLLPEHLLAIFMLSKVYLAFVVIAFRLMDQQQVQVQVDLLELMELPQMHLISSSLQYFSQICLDVGEGFREQVLKVALLLHLLANTKELKYRVLHFIFK